MDFKNVPKKYRPIPFWSWNEKLECDETRNQIKLMDEAGLGGFFMHARGGLQTEYMGEEWFSNVEASVSEAEKRGMGAWAYDENGWPSGFGSGLVNGLGVDYQQKY
ncbi:MAG: glycoside hydrolase, partial [Clostridia bacterium]|nr:glycoside hydrolase [Clostridia bacterium]